MKGMILIAAARPILNVLYQHTFKEAPKEEVERLILQAGGVKTLIGFLHGVSDSHKAKRESKKSAKAVNLEAKEATPCPIPNGLPRTK